MPIEADTQMLAMQETIYVGSSALWGALRDCGIGAKMHEEAADLLGWHLGPNNRSLVWGFSGYATGGIDLASGSPFSYNAEANGLLGIYGYLAAKNALPSLAFDGGTREGFLELNRVVAQSAGVETLGFLPEQGLGAVGVRDHLVVGGKTYKGRERAIATADVLVCAGGTGIPDVPYAKDAHAVGTAHECIRAVKAGATVLMLDLQEYPPASLPRTFHRHDDLRKAHDDGRLVVCRSLDTIPDCIDQVLETDVRRSRPLRSAILTNFLDLD